MNIFFCFFSLVFLVFIQPDKYGIFSPGLNVSLSVIYAVLILYFFITHPKDNKGWMRFDVIFLLGYTIVHIQVPFLASIGIEPLKPNLVWVNKQVVNYATWMSVVAINLWMLGYSISVKKERKLAFIDQTEYIVNYSLYDLILVLVYSGFLMTAGSTLLSGTYNTSNWGAGSTHFLLVLKILLYLRVIYFFRDLPKGASFMKIFKRVLSNKIFSSVILSYIVLFLLTGSRGEILRVFLVIAFGYSIYIHKISLKVVVVSVLIGSFLFTIMGLGRGRDSTQFGNQGIFERGYTTFINADNRPDFTGELASSVRIQYRAIDTVPDRYSYLYGTTYIATIFGAIPFASSLFVKIFDIPFQYLDSAHFFTYLGQGYNVSYGEGSEILADIYINFGLYGVYIVMFFFGLFSGKCTAEVRKLNFNYILIYTVLLITALSINRGTIFYLYKDLIYIFFINYVFSKRRI